MSEPSGMQQSEARFGMAVLYRMSVYNDCAKALHESGSLRFYASAQSGPWRGLPRELSLNHQLIGELRESAVRRFGWTGLDWQMRLMPWFDRWVQRKWVAGDHFLSGWPFGSGCFRYAKERGGVTFLEASSSHPVEFYELLQEEHRRWDCALPPIPKYQYARMQRALPYVDNVIAPSSFCRATYLARGFSPEQIILNPYRIDLSLFKPAAEGRVKGAPLRIISTGQLSLRKGTPYLLEAFRQVRKALPSAKLILPRQVADNFKEVLLRYADVPIEWFSKVPLQQLPALLQTADLMVLPSIEDGFGRVIAEALACGLPVITTPNTAGPDLIRSPWQGTIVPIRDPQALADAIVMWGERILADDAAPTPLLDAGEFEWTVYQRRLTFSLQEALARHGHTSVS